MNTKMKQIIRNCFFIMFTALLLGSLKPQITVQAAVKWKDICEPEVLSKTKVKLHWQPLKKIDGYIIYRSVVLKDDKKTALKKLATLSSKTSSYIDKASSKKTYYYEIVAFTQKGKTRKAIFKDSCYAYTGVGKIYWGEYLHSDAITTPKSIELLYYGDYNGLPPEKYEIYRSKTNGNYKKIATVKAKKNYWGGQYTDKNVTAGASYYYKVRGIKVMNGKKTYGKYSDPILLSAVNSVGMFQMETLTPKTETITSLDILLTSDKGNATLQLDSKNLWDISCWSKTQGEIPLNSILYSLDGKNWQPFTDEPVTVKPSDKVYLRFAYKDGKVFSNPAYGKTDYRLWLYDMTYNQLTCYLTLDFEKNTGTVQVNGEYYH